MTNIGFISLGCAKNQVDCERIDRKWENSSAVTIICCLPPFMNG